MYLCLLQRQAAHWAGMQIAAFLVLRKIEEMFQLGCASSLGVSTNFNITDSKKKKRGGGYGQENEVCISSYMPNHWADKVLRRGLVQKGFCSL